MLGRMIGKRGSVPNLVVAQRVIDKMTTAATSYLQDETGEAMVGLVIENASTGVSTLYVLDTIAPDASAVRHYHTFQQGDEHQDEILYWWRENWRTYRATLNAANPTQARWNTPLHHLGDWHKQPGFMIQPSGGDLMTAVEWINDPANNLGFMLAPILTLGHPTMDEPPAVTTNYLTIPDGTGTNFRIDWWYIDRKTRQFAPITPTVYENEHLPTLPTPPWHLRDETRFDLECRRLKDHGMFLSVSLWDTDGKIPLEVGMLAARADWDHLLLLMTPHDYPAQPPRARLAPFIKMDEHTDLFEVFERAYAKSTPLDAPTNWDENQWLIDYVKSIATTLKLPITPMQIATPPAPISDDIEPALDQAVSDAEAELVEREIEAVIEEEPILIDANIGVELIPPAPEPTPLEPPEKTEGDAS